MFKKTIAKLFILGLAVIFLFGCTPKSENTVKKIGVLQFAQHGSLDNCYEGFVNGLAAEGFVVGENIEINYQNAQADMARASQMASNMVMNNSDLMVGIATPAAQAALNAASQKKIPTLFCAVSVPENVVGEGTKGITGTSDKLPVKAQLEMIRKVLPNAKKIGIVYTTSEANSVEMIKLYKELAPALDFEIVEQGVSKREYIPLAVDRLLETVDCISNLTDNTVVQMLPTVIEKANAKKIPVFGSEIEQVQNGCVAAQGIDYIKLGESTGKMAAKVLRGEDINTIAIEYFDESELVVNTKAATGLGITFDNDFLLNATDVSK